IEEMVAKPDITIDQLQITTEAEKRQLLNEWNDTACDYPRERCLHQLFEEQARRTPNAIALVFEDKSLTYAALDQRADQLAALLRSRGIGPDVLVGLCVERSLEMVVGVLGILKAGGAYVPIDPAYPADRIAYVLEDSNASVLITQRPLLASLPKTNASHILIDEPLPKPIAIAISTAQLEPGHLAYVLYTSGSTGKPKGVQIPHRAVVNFLHSMRREPGLTANDVLLAVTTLSFDIAGLELHLPLTTGAKIILATAATASNGDALLATIKRHDVTMLQATPATWRLMLASGWKGSPRLKALCGGEALPTDLAAELLPRCAELWNMYGPTETTIWSTCSRVESATDIHIGRPIDNTEIYILDPHQQPLPIGLPGELLIGGDGLARGYHNRADLTADRFVPHPFKAGAKLYRTGDLARYRPDGNIDCLGRLDHQVKIRGFRIELGEIETQLASHPDVQQNVVVAREDTPGDKRLVAYVVPRPAASPTSTALRDHLRGNLPEYMLPAAFVFIENLPLTPNGKIDRKALPAPDSTAAPITKDAVAPRTPTETQLAAIFEKVLNSPVPSITDSFFDLGGHSLLATKLMADIETAFGQRLPLAKLFEAPCIEQLATILDSRSTAKTDWNSLVPINTGAKGPALYLVHGAGGNILLYRELARELMPDIKVFGFQSQGLDGQTSLLTTVDQMARHYTDELLHHQPQGPYFLGGYCMGGIVAYEMARLLRASGHSVGPVAMLDSYNLNAVHIERSFFSRLGSIRQKIFFHFENLRQMRFAEKCGYFREKIRMLIELIRLKVTSKIKLSPSNHNPTQTGKSSLATIQDINHRAGWDHVPGRYEGHLLLFKPRKNYNFFPDPDMGWKRLVTGQIDQIELTSHPHSMLIMPNVTKLAMELKARLPGNLGD
ncbi:MAG: amino acid adenylation domain-containing protein, partial [Verrucomicrobia bacterium]|nr:amino acid adenylation domain-containing protein [Verrucomicrobiota bacterium]